MLICRVFLDLVRIGSIIYCFRALGRVLVISMIAVALLGCLYFVLGMPPGYAGFVRSARPASMGISALSALGMAMIIVPMTQVSLRYRIVLASSSRPESGYDV